MCDICQMWMEMSLNPSIVNNPSLEQWALHVAHNRSLNVKWCFRIRSCSLFFIMRTTFKFQDKEHLGILLRPEIKSWTCNHLSPKWVHPTTIFFRILLFSKYEQNSDWQSRTNRNVACKTYANRIQNAAKQMSLESSVSSETMPGAG